MKPFRGLNAAVTRHIRAIEMLGVLMQSLAFRWSVGSDRTLVSFCLGVQYNGCHSALLVCDHQERSGLHRFERLLGRRRHPRNGAHCGVRFSVKQCE